MVKCKIRVLIVDDEPITRMDLKELLEQSGYEVVGEATDGFDAISACQKHHPDLVLMDIKMPLLNGIAASRIIYEEQLAESVMLVTAYSDREYIEEAKNYGVCGYLVKPINEQTIIPSIELAIARSKEIKSLKKDIKKVSERLENRVIIERVKGYLMDKGGLNENDAYRYLRKISQDKNIPMRKVADTIMMKCCD